MRRLGLLAIGLLVAGAAWVVVTGLMARSESHHLVANLAKLESDLTAGNTAAAQRLAQQMQQASQSAHAHTSGPAWWVASKLPILGRPVVSIRAQASLLDDLASTTLPAAVRAGVALDPHLLRVGSNGIDLTRLEAATPAIEEAATDAAATSRRAQSLPGTTWLSAANRSRAKLLREISDLDRGLGDLATAAHLLPGPLGATGVRRYFVAFETDAEARGLGGVPGDYAILRAANGHLTFTRFGSDLDLVGASSQLDLGANYAEMYNSQYGPQDIISNSDASPNFPDAARIWMGMWQDKFHQRLDGAIATDPTALGDLLTAVGAVTLADGTIINGSDSVRFFENATYLAFPSYDLTARKQFQITASQAVAKQILDQPSGDLLASATALQQAVDDGHLLVYVADPTVESSLADTPLAGILPRTDRPFLDVVVNNTSGTKLDYYLSRAVTYSRESCGASTVLVTVHLHNSAPSVGLPDSVLGRAPGIRPEPLIGEEGLMLYVYGTQGSSIIDVTVDGKPAYLETNVERGHPVAAIPLNIKSDQTMSVTFRFDDPAATGPLVVARQPTIRPEPTVIEGKAAC